MRVIALERVEVPLHSIVLIHVEVPRLLADAITRAGQQRWWIVPALVEVPRLSADAITRAGQQRLLIVPALVEVPQHAIALILAMAA